MNERSPSTSLINLYRRPGFLLRRAHQLSVAIFENACLDVALTPAQYGVLTVISEAEGIHQSELSRALGFDRVTTLHVVRGLTSRGLVLRKQSDEHGRLIRLLLTHEGRAVLAEAQQMAQQAHDQLLSPLTLGEQEQLIAILTKLCATLEPGARAPVVPPEPTRRNADLAASGEPKTRRKPSPGGIDRDGGRAK